MTMKKNINLFSGLMLLAGVVTAQDATVSGLKKVLKEPLMMIPPISTMQRAGARADCLT